MPSYLQPYTDAKGRIETDFAGLRVGLVHRAERERSLESQLESLANSKQAEMERSISLRQQGYRHRAFMLWIQTKVWSTWIDLAGSDFASCGADQQLRQDSTERGMPP